MIAVYLLCGFIYILGYLVCFGWLFSALDTLGKEEGRRVAGIIIALILVSLWSIIWPILFGYKLGKNFY